MEKPAFRLSGFAHEPGQTSLRDATVVSDELTAELRERVALAGVEVLESRITHLVYAPEIAQAMLGRLLNTGTLYS